MSNTATADTEQLFSADELEQKYRISAEEFKRLEEKLGIKKSQIDPESLSKQGWQRFDLDLTKPSNAKPSSDMNYVFLRSLHPEGHIIIQPHPDVAFFNTENGVYFYGPHYIIQKILHYVTFIAPKENDAKAIFQVVEYNEDGAAQISKFTFQQEETGQMNRTIHYSSGSVAQLFDYKFTEQTIERGEYNSEKDTASIGQNEDSIANTAAQNDNFIPGVLKPRIDVLGARVSEDNAPPPTTESAFFIIEAEKEIKPPVIIESPLIEEVHTEEIPPMGSSAIIFRGNTKTTVNLALKLSIADTTKSHVIGYMMLDENNAITSTHLLQPQASTANPKSSFTIPAVTEGSRLGIFVVDNASGLDPFSINGKTYRFPEINEPHFAKQGMYVDNHFIEGLFKVALNASGYPELHFLAGGKDIIIPRPVFISHGTEAQNQHYFETVAPSSILGMQHIAYSAGNFLSTLIGIDDGNNFDLKNITLSITPEQRHLIAPKLEISHVDTMNRAQVTFAHGSKHKSDTLQFHWQGLVYTQNAEITIDDVLVKVIFEQDSLAFYTNAAQSSGFFESLLQHIALHSYSGDFENSTRHFLFAIWKEGNEKGTNSADAINSLDFDVVPSGYEVVKHGKEGSDANEIIYGTSIGEALLGKRGDDIIYGKDGHDSIEGGQGNDFISGGAGHDTIYGNEGDDIITGNEGNDLLSGLSGNDIIFGNSGNDTLLGGDGKDRLSGGDGHDLLDGGSEKDTLLGGDGHDTLSGGAGEDILAGGSGRDVFAFKEGDSTKNNRDRITDFENESDKIDLSALTNIKGIADLDIQAEGNHVVITGKNNDFKLQLDDTNLVDITENDFIFDS